MECLSHGEVLEKHYRSLHRGMICSNLHLKKSTELLYGKRIIGWEASIESPCPLRRLLVTVVETERCRKIRGMFRDDLATSC